MTVEPGVTDLNPTEARRLSWPGCRACCYVFVAEAQTQLAGATEKERFASEKLMEVNARLSSLESQISVLRQERSRLLADLEVERTKYELVEEAKTK